MKKGSLPKLRLTPRFFALAASALVLITGTVWAIVYFSDDASEVSLSASPSAVSTLYPAASPDGGRQSGDELADAEQTPKPGEAADIFDDAYTPQFTPSPTSPPQSGTKRPSSAKPAATPAQGVSSAPGASSGGAAATPRPSVSAGASQQPGSAPTATPENLSDGEYTKRY